MPMLGDIFLNMVEEDAPNKSVKSTDHPIESGENITDHIARNAVPMTLKGLIVGNDAEQRRMKLENYMYSGTLLNYSYRTSLKNLIIESFTPIYVVEVGNGFKFELTVKQIRIAKASVLQTLKLPVKMQAAPVANKGRQQKQPVKDVKDKKNKVPKRSKGAIEAERVGLLHGKHYITDN